MLVPSRSNILFMLFSQNWFLYNCIFDVDLWPCDLELGSTSTSYWYISCVSVSSILYNYWFTISSRIKLGFIFTKLHIFYLELWPCDLELGSTTTSHYDVHHVWKHHQDLTTRSWFIGKNVSAFRTNLRTDICYG